MARFRPCSVPAILKFWERSITGWAVSSDSGSEHYSQCVADRRSQMMPPTCGRELFPFRKNENLVIFTAAGGVGNLEGILLKLSDDGAMPWALPWALPP